ncbi:HTH-type transcriptional activator CmpR [Desulfosporosinus acididurans]|uniref:HTH-type transcriptional activator CmpR n=1 Tax=Desulfosporosinus acididurans TaxID=476652 RepID=A0A0J1FQI1_9FIRM|nr:LysR family transcriptional regulator [Desulfosporosinus acididurans]KLU65749.1 HTH-type transcriptional activator CmpR [Desulfosporosinus acididurans]
MVVQLTDLILNQLRFFHSVARHLSYSKAGEELNLSQPAVSRQIASLEKSLGLDLFSQRGRQVILTDAGRSLYDYADRIMILAQQASRAMDQFHDLERGEVRLGASSIVGSYLLPSILKEFYSRFPNIKVSLTIDNDLQIARSVEEGELDLALLLGPVEADNVHIERFAQDDLILVCPTSDDGLPMNTLFSKYPLIIWEKCSSDHNIKEHLSGQGITTKLFMEIPDAEVIKRFVMSGIGIAFLPSRVVEEELAFKMLQKVKGDETTLPCWVYLITAKDQHYCPTLLAFMNFIRKYQ